MNRIQLPASVSTIEISSSCNAKCRWCTTGIKNRICYEKGQFMTARLFEQGIQRLLEIGWITEETKIELFNWGEPFLNPYFNEIMDVLVKYRLPFYLSTNGSIYRKLQKSAVDNMDFLMISLPGMTQSSYDKIHQLNAAQVQKNIQKFSDDLTQLGVPDKLWLNFHVYQFNLSELEAARKFAEFLNATFIPRTAYFNDFLLFDQFLSGTMGYADLYDASQQLFLHRCHTDKRQKKDCPLWGHICFDEQFNLLPCCRLTTKDSIGSLFSDHTERLISARQNYDLCTQCIVTGQSSLVTSGLAPGWYNDDLYPKVKHGEQAERLLEDFRSALAAKEGQLQAVTAIKMQAEAALEMTQKALEIKEEQLQAVNTVKAQAESALEMTQKALEIKEEQLQAVNAAKMQEETALRTIQGILTVKEEQVAQLIGEKDGIEQSRLKLVEQYKQLEVHINGIYKSASWKITKPIRIVSRILNGESGK